MHHNTMNAIVRYRKAGVTVWKIADDFGVSIPMVVSVLVDKKLVRFCSFDSLVAKSLNEKPKKTACRF